VHLRGLGWPVLPDTFNTASGAAESFSPQTPDVSVVQVLTTQGQQLPPSLAAAWAAAQSGAGSSGAAGSGAQAPSPAIAPSGQPLSAQTGAGLGVRNVAAIAPGIFQWTMSDGSQHYGDINGNPVSYTPPPATPTVTPAQSQPTQSVVPSMITITGNPWDGTSGGFMTSAPPVGTPVPAVNPSGQRISTTNGTPAQTVAPASSDIMLGTFDLTAFLTGSLIGGVPNWLLLGGAAALFFFSGGGSPRRR